MALLISALLVLYNNLINLLPQPTHDRLYIPVNLALGLMLLAWARLGCYSFKDLGLALDRLALGLRWGLVLGLALPAPLFLVLAMPQPMEPMVDARGWGQVSTAALAYQTMLRIPLGTAFLEELYFRGVLHGVWAGWRGVRAAVVGSSVAFGLWHVTPTLELMRGTGLFDHPLLLGLAVLGGVAATGLGGLFFAYLRLRTGAIYAPALTHWLVNSLSAFAAFLSAH